MKLENILRLLKKILGWPLSLLALFFLIKIIAPKALSVLPNLNDINFLRVFSGIICFIIYFFLRGLMWQKILKFKEHFIPLKAAVFLWGTSELQRYIPGGIWSFLKRTISFNDKGIEKKEIVHALVIEAQLIILGSLFLSIFSLFLFKDLFLNSFQKQIVIMFVLLILGIFIFHKNLFKFTNKKIFKYIFPNFSAYESFLTLSLSIVTFFFFGLATYLVSSSLHYLDVKNIFGFIGFFVFSLLVGYLSIIAPMGLGVREGIMATGLSKIISLEFAGLISIFSRLMFMFSEIIFIIIAFTWMRDKNNPTKN